MALLRQGMKAVATGANPLALTMESGFSALVRRIRGFIDVPTASAHQVSVDNRTVFEFTGLAGLNYLFNVFGSDALSILDELYRLGLVDPIPVAEGETLNITAPGGNGVIEVEYDHHTGGDFTGNEKNGKNGKSYQLFQMISNSAVPPGTGPVPLDQSDLSAQFPRFPGGAVVPANMTMTLRALFGSSLTAGTGAANAYYIDRLRLIRDREDITSLDQLGMIHRADPAYVGGPLLYETQAGDIRTGVRGMPPSVLVLDPYLEFKAGTKLDVVASAVVNIGAIGAGVVKLGMLFDVDMA